MKPPQVHDKVQMEGMVGYNHALFESMAQYCDAVVIVELKPGTIRILHSRRFPLLTGRVAPIIAMTDDAFREDKVQALSNGMNAHVPKPISMDVAEKSFSFIATVRCGIFNM